MFTPLLQAKLYAPPLPLQSVARPRLLEQLNAGLQWGSKLSLISAPAGFGKTTVAVAWLAQLERPFAWLSLDEGDNDPQQFLAYLIGALHTVHAKLGNGVLDEYKATEGANGLTTALTHLLNEVIRRPETPLILVLDDYHLIENPIIDEALSFWLTHQPAHVHLLITSRADPSLPLSRLRGRRQMTELRTDSLRFTVPEAAAFLENIFGLKLSDASITKLEMRTEGWVVGLQMAAISMQGSQDIASFVDAFSGSHRFVLDYLADEVLAQRPSGTQEFLLKTAMLDRFCAPLCDAVLASANSPSAQLVLEQLDAANLFLIPLDDQRHWYRYHHLFTDLLRQRLRINYPKEVAQLHLRASHWFAAQNLLDEAFTHALAAEAYEELADLVQTHASRLFKEGEVALVLRWFKRLPTDLVQSNTEMSLLQAWLYFFSQRPDLAETYLDLAEQTTGEPVLTATQNGRIAMLRGWIARMREQHTAAIRWHEQAFAHLGDGHPNNGLNTILLATALLADGQIDLAIDHYHQGIELALENGSLSAATGSAHRLAKLYLAQGQLQKAQALLEEMMAWAQQHNQANLPALGQVYVGLGTIYYERNQLDAAEEYLGKAVDTNQYATKTVTPALLQTGWINFWRGDARAAAEAVKKAAHHLDDWHVSGERLTLEGELVRLWLALGDDPAVSHWLAEHQNRADRATQLAIARILLVRGREQHHQPTLQRVAGMVTDWLTTVTEQGEQGRQITLLILHALTLDAQGDRDAALQAIRTAITLSEPAGYMRSFLDEGPPMAQLLYALVQHDGSQRYAATLLAAFPDEAPQSTAVADASPQMALVEPLSERELEVLQLVSEGLSNKEIAQKLYLSVGTVKVHTRNIYGKLGVSSRTQAVAKAQSFGII